MRALLVKILAASLSLAATAYLIQGFSLSTTWQSYLLGSIIFLLTSGILTPLLKLLLLPLNLLTLGLFRWVTNVIVLYIFDVLYQGVSISAYDFPGFNSSLLSLPPGHVNLFWSLVLSSLVIAVTYSLITSLFSAE